MLKPCRSPYCECAQDQCSHPGFYDARHLPYTYPKSFNPCPQCETQDHCEQRTCIYKMPIKPTHQAAYDFAQATLTQSAGEAMLNTALCTLGSDNQVIDLCEPILVAYRKLLTQFIGPELMDWLDWWLYECDHGTKKMEFYINGVEYNPQDMTLYRFLEIVDATN